MYVHLSLSIYIYDITIGRRIFLQSSSRVSGARARWALPGEKGEKGDRERERESARKSKRCRSPRVAPALRRRPREQPRGEAGKDEEITRANDKTNNHINHELRKTTYAQENRAERSKHAGPGATPNLPTKIIHT